MRGGKAAMQATIQPATLSVLFSLVLALSAPPARATNLEIYGHLPDLEDVAMSPDGTRVAFVETVGNKRIVRAVSLDDRKVLGQAEAGEEKLRRILWADNDHLLVESSVTGLPPGYFGDPAELYELRLFDVIKKNFSRVPDPQRIPALSFFPALLGGFQVRRLNDHPVLFTVVRLVPNTQQMAVRLDPTVQELGILREDLVTGAVSRIWSTNARDLQFFIDSTGEVAAENHYDEGQKRWSLKARVDGHLQEVTGGTSAFEIPRFMGYGPETDSLLVRALDAERPVWRVLSAKEGTLGAQMNGPMKGHDELPAPLEDRSREQMIGAMRDYEYRDYAFLDPAMQLRWDEVRHAFPGQHLQLVSHDRDLSRLIVMAVAPPRGLVYEMIDMHAHTRAVLGELYKGSGPPLEVQNISYAAADGMQIQAYLTLPRDRAMKDLPLIVLPHGGPDAHDNADFDWWSQALAEQGYAVLRPNFRGSNLTPALRMAGFGQWGRKMQTDLSDGVRNLVRQEIVDPKRVCIVGGSYGGYAALAGVALDPGVYRCAISYAGVADVSRQLSRVEDRSVVDRVTLRYLDRYMGVDGSRDPAVDAISPIKHIDVIDVPVLLIHGKDDTVVPFEQSQAMYDAMHRANKDVQLVELKAEDHWLSRSETRLQMLRASVDFLREHNPP
jgi:cephalosporin-C deacetylase-like acetyl esterase